MKNDHESVPASTHNNAAPARRRLLLAIGGGAGITTLHRLAVSGWMKPVIDTAVLPAHAGASNVINCPITICGTISVTGTNNFTFGLAIQGISTLTETITNAPSISTTVSLCATALLPPGSSAYLEAYASAFNPFVFNVTGSCCYTSGATSGMESDYLGRTLQFAIEDDGQCTFIPDDPG